MNCGENIANERIKQKMTQRVFAQKLGMSRQKLIKIEGNQYNMTFPLLEKLADTLNVSIGRLMGIDNDQRPSAPIYDEVISFGRYGKNIGCEEIPTYWNKNYNFYGLYMQDNEMLPRIFKGDVLLVQETGVAETGDLVVIKFKNKLNYDVVVIRQLIKMPNGIGLQSYNLETQFIEEGGYQILGRVIEIRAKLQYMKFN